MVATGAATDRHLGVPGEDLAGCVAATDLVAWYTGHPDAAPDAFTLDAETVVVVGAGNVAGDVARMLARTPDELRATDVPDHVLAAFAKSAVRDVHLVARRGPVQARFTTRELRELGELADADVLLDPADLELDDYSTEQLPTLPSARRNLEVLERWAAQPAARARATRAPALPHPAGRGARCRGPGDGCAAGADSRRHRRRRGRSR